MNGDLLIGMQSSIKRLLTYSGPSNLRKPN